MPWFTILPSACFTLGRWLHLEEILLGFVALPVGTTAAIGFVGVSPKLSVWFGMWLVGLLRISPRFNPYTVPKGILDHCKLTLDENELSCPAEITRDELRILGNDFRDALGRLCFLRGINLGGSSKMPVGWTTYDGPEQLTLPPAKLSFVGRPFSLSDAETHLKRLRAAGFTFLRLIVTWEAIEPEQPGVYNEEYVQFMVEVVRRAGALGMSVLIDPHQDVWSRYTGGSGAPRWTLEKVGFDTSLLAETGAAVLHAATKTRSKPPTMSWITNHMFFAAATMNTLFFAGDRYAPQCRIDGQSAQDFLQGAYVRAIAHLARALQGERNVIGYETMNEPSPGWVGCGPETGRRLEECGLHGPIGKIFTPWQSLQAANGATIRGVRVYNIPFIYSHTETLNPRGRRVWREGIRDLWAEHGLWDDSQPAAEARLLRQSYFMLDPEPGHDPADWMPLFQTRYLKPFWERFAGAIREATGNPEEMIFTDPAVQLDKPHLPVARPEDKMEGVRQVWSPHWYDGITILSTVYHSWVGADLATPAFPLRLTPWAANHAADSSVRATAQGGMTIGPCLLGEVGSPWVGSMAATALAVERTQRAVDRAMIPAVTIWNYTPLHTKLDGDSWNGEDLSIWTTEDGGFFRMPNSVRPYPRRLAGRPERWVFSALDPRKPFELAWREVEGCESAESVFFVPQLHYRGGALDVQVSDGEWAFDKSKQTLSLRHEKGKNAGRHWVKLALLQK